jgi:drug/metabolite transporter (DMT)-like permease
VTTNHLALVGRLSYLDPLISTLLLMIFMGLLPTPAAWIGMILIILGVALPEIWTFLVTSRSSTVG